MTRVLFHIGIPNCFFSLPLSTGHGHASLTRGHCVRSHGTRCVHRWQKQQITILQPWCDAVNNADHTKIHSISLMEVCAFAQKLCVQAVLISRSQPVNPAGYPASSFRLKASIDRLSELQTAASVALRCVGNVSSVPAGTEACEIVGTSGWLRCLCNEMLYLVHSASILHHNNADAQPIYHCEICLRPRAERKAYGCCMKPGNALCRHLGQMHHHEQQKQSSDDLNLFEMFCPQCKRPASAKRQLGKCYRPSADHPQSLICRTLAAILQRQGCPNVIEHGHLETDSICQHCHRSITMKRRQGGCYRENGREAHRFPSCYKRERELASNAHDTSISFCPFCHLPLSNKKRAGFCSSIGQSGVPGRNCQRRQKAALAARSLGVVRQIHLLDDRLLDFRLTVIRASLAQFGKPIMSEHVMLSLFGGTHDPLSLDLLKQNVFITGISPTLYSLITLPHSTYQHHLISPPHSACTHLLIHSSTHHSSLITLTCLFIGPAGTGKTMELLLACQRLLEMYKCQPGAVALTASTASAAAIFGGLTFHSFLGLGASGGICDVSRRSSLEQLKILVVHEV